MTSDLQHEPYEGLAGLYAIGGLNRTDRERFELHLETCHECVRSVRSLLPVAHALLQAAAPQRPSGGFQARILGLDTELPPDTSDPAESRGPLAPVYRVAAVACLILSAGLGWYAAQHVNTARQLRNSLEVSTRRVEAVASEAATSQRAAEELRARADILAAPDVTTVDLQGQPAAPNAAGRLFLSASRGAIVTASNVPPLPPGHVYHVWFVIPPDPVSAGVVPVDRVGRMFGGIDPPAETDRPIAVAVTLEPDAGVTEPTGDVYLLGRTDQ